MGINERVPLMGLSIILTHGSFIYVPKEKIKLVHGKRDWNGMKVKKEGKCRVGFRFKMKIPTICIIIYIISSFRLKRLLATFMHSSKEF